MLEGEACVSATGGSGAAPLQLEQPGVLSLLCQQGAFVCGITSQFCSGTGAAGSLH